MLSLEEMTSWSPEDIRAAIAAELPLGWSFVPDVVNSWVHAKIVDAEGTVLWEDSSADQRLLYFNAYGWLNLRSSQARHPAWRPRTKEVDPSERRSPREWPSEAEFKPRAHQGGAEASIPDPEDLDPAEVYSVYQDPHSKRK